MSTYHDLPLFRASDPDTSRAGAESIQKALGARLRTLLAVYWHAYPNGLTDEQACDSAALFHGGWKRCADLRRLGFIRDTGERRPLSSGRNGMVCVITAEGQEELNRG